MTDRGQESAALAMGRAQLALTATLLYLTLFLLAFYKGLDLGVVMWLFAPLICTFILVGLIGLTLWYCVVAIMQIYADAALQAKTRPLLALCVLTAPVCLGLYFASGAILSDEAERWRTLNVPDAKARDVGDPGPDVRK